MFVNTHAPKSSNTAVGRHFSLAILVAAISLSCAFAAIADEFERPPINYSESTPDNVISALQAKIDGGEVELEYAGRRGYLASVLNQLHVPPESQMLVFSKTSLQRQRISPSTPRAIYFNDDVYVGFCQSGTVLEISAVDPQLGTVFYTLDQEQVERPEFVRQTDSCLLCHSSSRTEGVPGHVVRSMYVDMGGEPIYSAGSYTVDHTTPFEKRWGGWYVTGTHGGQTHLGNLITQGRTILKAHENVQGQNVTSLRERLDTDHYLAPTSDIAALMVLEHQTLVHNRLTRANFETRQALHYQEEMNRMLGKEADQPLESVERRIQRAGDLLVEAMLFADETELTAPVHGASKFSERFADSGPRDSQGRSLRDLDLEHRLLRYPCSYLIYSRSFDALPEVVRSYVYQRLWNILANGDDAEEYEHLSAADRRAIMEILRDTKSGLPDYWRRDS
jgi:hypothetical protein